MSCDSRVRITASRERHKDGRAIDPNTGPNRKARRAEASRKRSWCRLAKKLRKLDAMIATLEG